MVQLRRNVAVLLAVLVALVALGAALWATNGFGRESTKCPRDARAQVVQPKEGPGRPPICPAAKP
jgi:ABC-type transporter Mla subunit MlaD